MAIPMKVKAAPAAVSASPTSDEINALLNTLQSSGDTAKVKMLEQALWQREDVGITHDGSKIILPALPREMSLSAGIEALQRRQKADEQVVTVREFINGYPFDTAVAFVKAMQNRYGWADAIPTPTWWGEVPPTMLPVRVGPEADDVVQVPMGRFTVPGISAPIDARIVDSNTFMIQGEIKNADKAVVMQLITDTKKLLEVSSIYKGKALRIEVDDDGELIQGVQPVFLHTKHVKEDELIFSDNVRQLLDVTLFTPIRKTALTMKHGIPLKRGILLAGPYGTGKSMTASVASKIAVENGWSFILLSNVAGLRAGLEFAKRYEPAVLFAEDIDRIIEDRDDDANDLLNTIDGVLSKDAKVITVVTTNHIEKINKAMMRPGRLDAVIQVLAPDAGAAERLVRLYARGLLADNVKLDRLGEALKGQIPATIREVVERSKLGMISREADTLIERDLLIAASGMKQHLDLLNGVKVDAPNAEERLGRAMVDVVKNAFNGNTEAIHVTKVNVDAMMKHFEV